MKRIIALGILAVVVALPAAAQSPPDYPGAVRAGAGSQSEYLVRAAFPEVRDFYGAALGPPREQTPNAAYFVYASRPLNPGVTETTGVYVSTGGNAIGPVAQVLSDLQQLVGRGGLSQARYEALEQQASTAKHLYYRDDGSGRPADRAIRERYAHILRTGSSLTPAEAEKKMMELVQQGDMAGLQALTQEMQRGASRAMELQQSPSRQAEHWIECLEEIMRAADQLGYPVHVEMRSVRQMIEGDKG
ncbi:MAG: hypothetical protein EA427_01525 [Spirochaetaceae bacterium]|nr:MAG: hypothetical protein EA427_01525 [Spirochaetaceae bacterium]